VRDLACNKAVVKSQEFGIHCFSASNARTRR
jgi:hypothetical protein